MAKRFDTVIKNSIYGNRRRFAGMAEYFLGRINEDNSKQNERDNEHLPPPFKRKKFSKKVHFNLKHIYIDEDPIARALRFHDTNQIDPIAQIDQLSRYNSNINTNCYIVFSHPPK